MRAKGATRKRQEFRQCAFWPYVVVAVSSCCLLVSLLSRETKCMIVSDLGIPLCANDVLDLEQSMQQWRERGQEFTTKPPSEAEVSERAKHKSLQLEVISRARRSKSEDQGQEIASAIQALERIGASQEVRYRRSAELSRREVLRGQLASVLRQKVHNHTFQVEVAKRKISAALQTLTARNVALFQATRNSIEVQRFAGKWILGADCQSCNEACQKEDQHKFCNLTALCLLTDEVSLRLAYKKTAEMIQCDGVREIAAEVPWDGPWKDGAGICAYNSKIDLDCEQAITCGYQRLCPCSVEEHIAKREEDFEKRPTNGAHERYEPTSVFTDITVAFPLARDLLLPATGGGEEMRAVVGPNYLKAGGRSCLVYAFGAAYETGYEKRMVELGCTVHVFDCTMSEPEKLLEYLTAVVALGYVVFHPWCIGEHNTKMGESIWGTAPPDAFFTFDEIMDKLNHKSVDIVKFDVEGFEWRLLDSLLAGRRLPDQLAFELHTSAANPSAVPQHLTKFQGRREVAELFQKLYDLSYYVVAKDINLEDLACCEFVLARVLGADADKAADKSRLPSALFILLMVFFYWV